MKKFYCYYCQEDVNPTGFWKFRFCPKCRRHLTDKGEGFYRVCEVCGANLPADAKKCVRCNHVFAMENAMEQYEFRKYVFENSWMNWILAVFAFIVSIIVALGIFYVSFYFVAAILLFALILLVFNMIRASLHI